MNLVNIIWYGCIVGGWIMFLSNFVTRKRRKAFVGMFKTRIFYVMIIVGAIAGVVASKPLQNSQLTTWDLKVGLAYLMIGLGALNLVTFAIHLDRKRKGQDASNATGEVQPHDSEAGQSR